MYNELITIVTLLAIIVILVVNLVLQRRDNAKVQTDLLNRIMSRNYETYVQAEIAQHEKKPLTMEELYEIQQERGIPV